MPNRQRQQPGDRPSTGAWATQNLPFESICKLHHYRAIQKIAPAPPYAQRLRSYKEATRPRGHFRADGIHGAKIDSQQVRLGWLRCCGDTGIRQRLQNKNAKRELDWQALSLVVSQLT